MPNTKRSAKHQAGVAARDHEFAISSIRAASRDLPAKITRDEVISALMKAMQVGDNLGATGDEYFDNEDFAGAEGFYLSSGNAYETLRIVAEILRGKM